VQWGPNNEQLSYWKTDAFKEAKEWLPQVLVVMLGTNDSKYSPWYVYTCIVRRYRSAPMVYLLGDDIGNLQRCVDQGHVA
jgi:hypothetical protein